MVSNYLQVCCQYCHKRVIQMKIKLSLRDVKTATFTSFAHKLTKQILIFHWNHLHITYFNYLHRTDRQRTIRDNNIHWNQFYPTCHLPTMPASAKTLPLLASRIFPLMVARLEINASLLCDSEADVRKTPNVLLYFNPFVGDWFGAAPHPPCTPGSLTHAFRFVL